MQGMKASELPSSVLRAEHRVILRVIGVLERLVKRSEGGGSFERDSLQACVEFFRLFADACHHAKEEDLLFPVLESRGIPREGGPIGVMLEEHKLARAYTREMAEALDDLKGDQSDTHDCFHSAAHHYIDLLRQHIDKEDNVLFHMGDHVMTDEDQATLCSRFCEVGCGTFGGKKREQLERIAEDLEAKWPN